MDIVIKDLSERFLLRNLDQFLDILYRVPYEYWNKDNFLKRLPFKFRFSIYATFNEEIIGYIISSKKGDYAYIHKFMVREKYRNKQVGEKLQIAFEKKISNYTIVTIRLCVLKINENAVRFYERNGYKEEDKKIDNINKLDLLVMKKELL